MGFDDYKFNDIENPIPSVANYIQLKSNILKEKKDSPKISLLEIIISQITLNKFDIESIIKFIKKDKMFLNILRVDCEKMNLISMDTKKQLNIRDIFKKKKL